MTIDIQTTAKAPRPIRLGRLVNWLLQLDRNYRQAQKLARMPAARLEDMGLSRSDAKRAFRPQGGQE